VSEIHEKLKIAFAVYVQETERFEEKGVKVSAVRARQALNELKTLIPLRRKEIQDKKNIM
jgi:hypothetical protein